MFRRFASVGAVAVMASVVAIVACTTHIIEPNSSPSVHTEQTSAVLSFYDYINHPTVRLKNRVGSALSSDLKHSLRMTWTQRYSFMHNVRPIIDDATDSRVRYTVTYDYIGNKGWKLGWRRTGEWTFIHGREKWLLNRDDYSDVITTVTIRGDPPLYVNDSVDSHGRHSFWLLGYLKEFTQTPKGWSLVTIATAKGRPASVADLHARSVQIRHNVLWALSTLFLFVTVLLGFAEFLIGDDDRAIRDRLADWYVNIEEGDWSKLVTFATTTTERFFSYVFGPRIISVRYLLIAIPVSAAIALLALVSPPTIAYEQLSPFQQQVVNTRMFQQILSANGWLFATVLVGNVCIDVAALAAARWYFRRVSVRAKPNIARDVFVLVLVVYLSVGISMNLLALSAVFIVRAAGTQLEFLPLPLYLLGPLWLPIRVAMLDPRGVFVPLIIVAPSGFFAFVLLGIYVGSVLAFVSRPFTREPLAIFVERLATAKNGVLPTIAAGFTATAACIALFR